MKPTKSADIWDDQAYAALMALCDRVMPQLPMLAASIAQKYVAEFEEYARLLPDAQEQVIESAFLNLKALMAEIDPRQPLVAAYDRQAFERIGAVRMRMGISIESLMRSFNVWGQQTWQHFRSQVDPDSRTQTDALLHISERIFWHVEQATASVARGYMREAAASWTDREMTRYAVLEALISGRIDDLQLANSSVAKDLASGYLAVVAVHRANAGPNQRSMQELVKHISGVVGAAVTTGRPLVGSNAGDLFALWPEPVIDRDGARVLAVVGDLQLALPGLAFGVGEPSRDLIGVAASFRQARDAARIADALNSPGPLRFLDLDLERIVLASDDLRGLAVRTLEPLHSYDRRRKSDLIETLSVFIDSGLNVIDTAGRLFVHPNTVSYRLRRIGEISGHDPKSGRGMLVLSLALLGSRLSGAMRPERSA